MSGWHALCPMKLSDQSKSRLSGTLSPAERRMLVRQLALHVLGTLEQCSPIERITILSPEIPDFWPTESARQWVRDQGRGLNSEITTWHQANAGKKVLIVHADLPLVQAKDIEALISAAELEGVAIATDRAGTGTNALAIMPSRSIKFSFGSNSCALHKAQCASFTILGDEGLSADLDTADDLAFATKRGFAPRFHHA